MNENSLNNIGIGFENVNILCVIGCMMVCILFCNYVL